jgi:long-chain acyl-CoA synthetase
MNVVELGDELSRRAGDYLSQIFEGREYRSSELRRMQLRLARAWRDLGVQPGDRIAVMTPNCPEVGPVYASCWRVGGVTVPMLFLLAQPEVEHILADSAPRVVVTSPEFLGTIQKAVATLERKPELVVIGEPAPEGTHAISALIESSSEDHAVEPRDPTDLSAILYTGGTTGRPKGVMLTHGGMIGIIDSVVEATEVEDGKVTLVALPLAHAYGIVTGLGGMKVIGTGVLMRWFDAEGALRLIQEHRVNYFASVPTMLVYMLRHPNFDEYDLSSLERIASAAAPCPVELLEEAERRFGCPVYEGYGLTESTIACASQRPSQPKIVGSVGKPIPGVVVQIRDDEDREVHSGEVGEVCIQGPNVMAGYYRMPEATAQAIRDGWLHTGDMGRLDEDGNLYIVDRKKDMIIRGGLNIYPRDVEEVLHQHPGVAEAAVVGRPDAVYGEEVVAFVVRREGGSPSEQELIDFSRQTLAKYKSPKEVVFVDTLPKSGVGKVLRRALREQLVRSSTEAATAG